MTRRTIICHYHIFKTAGTSFEKILRNNFGERHLSFDGPTTSSVISQPELVSVIDANPDLVSLSSHQITLPAPTSDLFTLVPVIFVRHPILRIRSVFLHENRHRHNMSEGASLAGFDSWFEGLLSGDPNQLQICNLQTNLLSRAYDKPPVGQEIDGRPVYDLDAALDNLSKVACLGRTEYFDRDVASFIPILFERGFDLEYATPIRENVGAPDFGLSHLEQLQRMQADLSTETWDLLHWFNHQDLALFKAVCGRIDS